MGRFREKLMAALEVKSLLRNDHFSVDGAVAGAVVREDTAAGDALLAEPAHGTGRNPTVVAFCSSGSTSTYAKSGGIIDCHVDLLVTSTKGAALTAIAGDLVADPLKPGQWLGVDVEHVARLFPLVPLHRRLGPCFAGDRVQGASSPVRRWIEARQQPWRSS